MSHSAKVGIATVSKNKSSLKKPGGKKDEQMMPIFNSDFGDMDDQNTKKNMNDIASNEM